MEYGRRRSDKYYPTAIDTIFTVTVYVLIFLCGAILAINLVGYFCGTPLTKPSWYQIIGSLVVPSYLAYINETSVE